MPRNACPHNSIPQKKSCLEFQHFLSKFHPCYQTHLIISLILNECRCYFRLYWKKFSLMILIFLKRFCATSTRTRSPISFLVHQEGVLRQGWPVFPLSFYIYYIICEKEMAVTFVTNLKLPKYPWLIKIIYSWVQIHNLHYEHMHLNHSTKFHHVIQKCITYTYY